MRFTKLKKKHKYETINKGLLIFAIYANVKIFYHYGYSYKIKLCYILNELCKLINIINVFKFYNDF